MRQGRRCGGRGFQRRPLLLLLLIRALLPRSCFCLFGSFAGSGAIAVHFESRALGGASRNCRNGKKLVRMVDWWQVAFCLLVDDYTVWATVTRSLGPVCSLALVARPPRKPSKNNNELVLPIRPAEAQPRPPPLSPPITCLSFPLNVATGGVEPSLTSPPLEQRLAWSGPNVAAAEARRYCHLSSPISTLIARGTDLPRTAPQTASDGNWWKLLL